MSFGGGLVVLAVMRKELVLKKKWLKTGQLLDLYSLSQCIPGVIIINLAAFVGHKKYGKKGAVLAVLGTIIPPSLLVLLFTVLLNQYVHLDWVQQMLAGIRVGVVAIIIKMAISLWKDAIKDQQAVIIAVLAGILLLFFNNLPLLVLFVCGGIGYLLNWRKK